MSRRRGRGEGSIVERADGRWMARLDLGWSNGRRRRKTLYGKTRREVANKLNQAHERARAGELVTDERQTVAQFFTIWLRDVARARVRPRTYDTYEGAVRRHILPYLGPRPVARLTPQHLQAWLADLEAGGVSAGRRRYARVVLRTALNTAVRWRLVSRNVATLVDPPRTAMREIRSLTPEDARRLLRTAKGDPQHAFVAIGLGCGLRLGETLGLQWSDVDLKAGVLHVRRALHRFGGDRASRLPLLAQRKRLLAALRSPGARRTEFEPQLAAVREKLRALKTTVQIVEPKSHRSRRTLALPAVTVAALQAHRVRQLKARLAAGAAWRDAGFVFTSPVGTPCDPHNIQKRFKRLLVDAELPGVRIHDLRHSCASLLLAPGVDPRTIMETLGHSQISLTLNTYTHVLPHLQRNAAARLDAVLGRGKS